MHVLREILFIFSIVLLSVSTSKADQCNQLTAPDDPTFTWRRVVGGHCLNGRDARGGIDFPLSVSMVKPTRLLSANEVDVAAEVSFLGKNGEAGLSVGYKGPLDSNQYACVISKVDNAFEFAIVEIAGTTPTILARGNPAEVGPGYPTTVEGNIQLRCQLSGRSIRLFFKPSTQTNYQLITFADGSGTLDGIGDVGVRSKGDVQFRGFRYADPPKAAKSPTLSLRHGIVIDVDQSESAGYNEPTQPNVECSDNLAIPSSSAVWSRMLGGHCLNGRQARGGSDHDISLSIVNTIPPPGEPLPAYLSQPFADVHARVTIQDDVSRTVAFGGVSVGYQGINGAGDRNQYSCLLRGGEGRYDAQIWEILPNSAKVLASAQVAGGSGDVRCILLGNQLMLYFEDQPLLRVQRDSTKLSGIGKVGIRSHGNVQFTHFGYDGYPMSSTTLRQLSSNDVKLIKHMGFDHVKLLYSPHMFMNSDGTLNTIRLADMNRAINTVVTNGLPVLVTVHPQDWFKKNYLGNNDQFQILARWYGNFARYLASNWRESQVALQIMTEPNFVSAPTWATQQNLLRAAVRAAMPNHTLVFSSVLAASGEQLSEFVKLLPFPNEWNAHYSFTTYEPAEIGFNALIPRAPSEDPNAIIPVPTVPPMDWFMNQSAKIRGWLFKNGGIHHVMVVEFGCLDHKMARNIWRQRFPTNATNQFISMRLDFIKKLRTALEGVGVGWSYWSYNETFTVFNPAYRFVDPELDAGLNPFVYPFQEFSNAQTQQLIGGSPIIDTGLLNALGLR